MSFHVSVPEGTYIIAVSGGVDSVVLLHALSMQPNVRLVVAHFDHGIRHNSAEDAVFVREIATEFSLQYEEERAELGVNASEEVARKARYDFLGALVKKYQASAIITAHHQDDVIETSIINLLRGTGRHGLTSLKSRQGMLRPLLSYPKQELLSYASAHKLAWREDPTNEDVKYLRNKVRHQIVPKMSVEQRAQWLAILQSAYDVNEKIDSEIQNLLRRGLHKGSPVLSRSWFVLLPHDIAKEVIMVILRQVGAHDIDRKTVERLVIQIKTLAQGKVLEASGATIVLTKRSARFKNR
jgi:tRNA(Ile)-lysidine synthetase-like protein